MVRRWAHALGLAAALLHVPVAGAVPVEFLDGTFDDADWEIAIEGGDAASSHSFGQASAGLGNPDPYRRMTHTNPVDPEGMGSTSVNVTHRRLGWVYDPSVSGAIESMSLAQDRIVFDVLSDGVPATGAVGHVFRIFQDGRSFIPLLELDERAFSSRSWENVTLPGLTAADFETGGLQPDFSASGAPLMFGYSRSNTNSGQTSEVVTIHGIDSFGVTVVPVETPEAGAVWLVGSALLGLIGAGRRTRSA